MQTRRIHPTFAPTTVHRLPHCLCRFVPQRAIRNTMLH
jgi:hypothetical protein